MLKVQRQNYEYFARPVIGMHTTKEALMEQYKFQWSLFPDAARQEQYVVRCDEFADFLEAIELVKTLFNGAEPIPIREPEIPADQCAIHNKPMRLRTGKNGNTWYDHRWKVETPQGEVWYVCNGKQEKVQANGKS